MTSSDDLNKLFEAALGDKQAPSRYGTPEEQKKFSPVPVHQQQAPAPAQQHGFQAPPAPNAFQAAPPAPGYVQPPASAFQTTPAPQTPQPFQQPAFAPAPAPAPEQPADDLVSLDNRGQASLETGISAELGAIMDAKIARAKRKRKRSLILMALFFVGGTGGSAAWVAANPERIDAMKKVVAEIKSVGDIQGMVEKYQKALDKIAVRGEQINEATLSMGVDPASAENMADQGFDKEMREMMGEDGGPTTAARNAKLQEKFKHVQEGGSLMGGPEAKAAAAGGKED